MNICYFGSGSLHNHGWSVDGGKFIRIPLFEELGYRGHTITWLGFDKEQNIFNPWITVLNIKKENFLIDIHNKSYIKNLERNYTEKDLDACDICIIELRPFYSKAGYGFEEESQEQINLINYFYDKGKPIFLNDQDGWYADVPDEIAKKVILLKAYEKEIKDSRFIDIKFFLWAHSKILPGSFDKYSFDNRPFDFFYCGNVYERREEFKKYFLKIHNENFHVGITGNWLRKKYDDRDFALDTFPKFMFLGQTEHWTTLPFYNLSKAAFHVSNPRQQELGIICIRVFEVLMGHCLLFANKNIYGIEKYLDQFQLFESGEELYDKYSYIAKNNKYEWLYEKYYKAMEQYNIQNHVNLLESYIKEFIK